MPTNNQSTRQLKQKNWNIAEVAHDLHRQVEKPVYPTTALPRPDHWRQREIRRGKERFGALDLDPTLTSGDRERSGRISLSLTSTQLFTCDRERSGTNYNREIRPVCSFFQPDLILAYVEEIHRVFWFYLIFLFQAYVSTYHWKAKNAKFLPGPDWSYSHN
jgi:hypothetical protein